MTMDNQDPIWKATHCRLCGYPRPEDKGKRHRRMYMDEGKGVICGRCLKYIGKRAGK